MAKGLRSKVKKRTRTARRQHYWEVEGKGLLEETSRRLQDPTWVPKPLSANAYVEPGNPTAVFPQHSKPHIIDFRDHKMALAGYTSRGVSRKHLSDRTKKSKYQTVIKTAADLAEEAKQEEEATLLKEQARASLMHDDKNGDSDDEIDLAA